MPLSSRTILHIDANSFFASVESSVNPSLRGTAFAVGGDQKNRRGVILASSYEAKTKYGIKTGEPIVHALKKYPRLNIIQSNHKLYMEYSHRLHAIFADYSDLVEAFSCDEAWIDVTGCGRLFGTGTEIADTIRRRVKSELGITVSIGVSFNKTMAKIGSDYKKPDAVTEITRENFKDIVWPLPVGALIYAGRSTVSKLNSRGIYTIGDFARADEKLVSAWLGKNGRSLHDQALGIDPSPVERAGSKREIKSISNSTTLKRDLETEDDVKAVIIFLSDKIAKRARAAGLAGKSVGISIRDERLSVITRQKTLSRHTDLSCEIAEAAMELFRANYSWLRKIRSLGVRLDELAGENRCSQISLWDDDTVHEREKKLERTCDKLAERFGDKYITRGILMKNRDLLQSSDKEKPGFSED